jgi:integrase
VPEKDWDDKKQQVKNSSKVSSSIVRLNNILKSEAAEIYDRISELDIADTLKHLSPKELKQELFPPEEANSNIYTYMDMLIDEKLRTRKKSSALAYRGVKRKLFDLYGNRLNSFEQVDYSVLKKMETKHIEDGGSYGGLGVYMRTLRAICNRAIKDKVVSADLYPFKDYKIRTADTQRRSLSEADYEKLKSFQSESAPLRYAHDLFMASFYMRGMNFIDMAYLKANNIEGDFDRIKYQRNKTGKFFSLKVSQPLKEILVKYIMRNQGEDFIFPVLDSSVPKEGYYERIRNSRMRVNKSLRKITKELEIEPFTIYAARHTYATRGKRVGVPTAIIQESLGHQTEAITQAYLNSFENSVIDDYDELIMG